MWTDLILIFVLIGIIGMACAFIIREKKRAGSVSDVLMQIAALPKEIADAPKKTKNWQRKVLYFTLFFVILKGGILLRNIP